jgi:zinc protease
VRPAYVVVAILSVFSCAFLRGEESSAAKSVTVPAMDFKHSSLPNGLEIYAVEDHSAPIVAVQVWYHVGSKDDPQGRSGFAHLFEHMMFKGNEHMSPDMFDNLTENIGGENNAYTADDVTVYHETVPSNYLNPILWAEAERMSALALNDANFASERDVVKEEYRQRIRANPYGEFYHDIEKKSFAVHPYKRPGIGNIEELDASKLPEVKAFHSTFYRPDNATLVVVGDFNPVELEGWVKKYFGAIPKPAAKIPRVSVKEPPRKADKRDTTYSPRAPLPAVAITYLAPSIRSDDSPALSLAAEILAGGDSSRLYEKMVYEQQVVQSVSCDSDLREDLGLVVFRLILASGKTIADAEASLNKEIDDVLKNGVTEEELQKAKNRFLTGKLEERETVNGKASALGQAIVMYGDASRVNTDLGKLQAVTTAQIKEVMNRFITGKKKVVVEYLPETMKPGAVPPSRKKEPKP